MYALHTMQSLLVSKLDMHRQTIILHDTHSIRKYAIHTVKHTKQSSSEHAQEAAIRVSSDDESVQIVCIADGLSSSNIVDIAWNLSSDGQYLLAVALSNTIAIYGEKRGTNPMEDLNQWIPYTEFDVQR